MADQEIIKHMEKAVHIARHSKKNWKDKFKDILLEILIIVFAVSLSIWLHNWSERSKDHKEEKEFLSGLREDLQADILEMKKDCTLYEKSLNGIAYFNRVGSGEAINKDSLFEYRTGLMSYAQFEPRISRFEALRGSGKLGIIGDKQLLIDITDLYTKNIPHVRRLNDYIINLQVNHVLPLLTQHLQLNTGSLGADWESFLRLSETRVTFNALNAAANNIIAYKEAIDKSQAIINRIGENLK